MDLLVLFRTRPGQTLDVNGPARGDSTESLVLLGLALCAWRRVSPAFAEPDLPGDLPWVMELLQATSPGDMVAQNAGARGLADAVRSDGPLREDMARLRRE